MLPAFHTRDTLLVKVNAEVQHNTAQHRLSLNLLRQELLNSSSQGGKGRFTNNNESKIMNICSFGVRAIGTMINVSQQRAER